MTAIRKVMNEDARSEMETMCETAHEIASRRFTFENHCEKMLKILDEAIMEYYQDGTSAQ